MIDCQTCIHYKKNCKADIAEQTKRKKLNKNEILSPNELIPNPIRIKNSNNYENISEKILQRLILEDIASFLKEQIFERCILLSGREGKGTIEKIEVLE